MLNIDPIKNIGSLDLENLNDLAYRTILDQFETERCTICASNKKNSVNKTIYNLFSKDLEVILKDVSYSNTSWLIGIFPHNYIQHGELFDITGEFDEAKARATNNYLFFPKRPEECIRYVKENDICFPYMFCAVKITKFNPSSREVEETAYPFVIYIDLFTGKIRAFYDKQVFQNNQTMSDFDSKINLLINHSETCCEKDNKDSVLGINSKGETVWMDNFSSSYTLSKNFKETLEKDFVTKEELDNSINFFNDKFNDKCNNIGYMINEHMNGNPAYRHLGDNYHFVSRRRTSIMKKFIKKAFITIFTIVGIYSTANYFAGDLVNNLVSNIKSTCYSIGVNIIGTDNIGREWNSYSTEDKKKIFEALNFENKKKLIEYLNSGINDKVKKFEENIK